MILSDFLFNREFIIDEVSKLSRSPARTKIIDLIKMTNQELITATFNTWLNKQYSTELTPTVPKMLVPDIQDPNEFFQFITDNLKKSIQE
jgi:hypothetical protein